MIALNEPMLRASAERVCELDISLKGVKPRVWRRLVVPARANLGWLHAAIQLAMGWSNSHMHRFVIRRKSYSDPSFELDDLEGDPPVADEHRFALADVAGEPERRFTYEYDFGDSWVHSIRVRDLRDAEAGESATALCTAGASACPPEDCGGPWGYQNLLDVVIDPKNEEQRALKRWLGPNFDPARFDREGANQLLRKLPWPAVTGEQVRRLARVKPTGGKA